MQNFFVKLPFLCEMDTFESVDADFHVSLIEQMIAWPDDVLSNHKNNNPKNLPLLDVIEARRGPGKQKLVFYSPFLEGGYFGVDSDQVHFLWLDFFNDQVKSLVREAQENGQNDTSLMDFLSHDQKSIFQNNPDSVVVVTQKDYGNAAFEGFEYYNSRVRDNVERIYQNWAAQKEREFLKEGLFEKHFEPADGMPKKLRL